MPTEYPLGKARKLSLAANRKSHQERARRRIIEDMPRIAKALQASYHARHSWHSERTGNMGFSWLGRVVRYAVTTQTLVVKTVKDTAVYTHYTPDQLIKALLTVDPEVAVKLFRTNADVRLIHTAEETKHE